MSNRYYVVDPAGHAYVDALDATPCQGLVQLPQGPSLLFRKTEHVQEALPLRPAQRGLP